MLPYRDSRLTRIILGIFFLIVLGYAYYEARGLLFGPTISISSGATNIVESPYVLIQGQADRIASLAVDGNPIQVTETGAFQEPYVLSPGVNRIVFDAKDKYGHTTEKVVEIVYQPSASAAVPAAAATSSALSASSSPAIAPGQ
jgi:hypothetical protein